MPPRTLSLRARTTLLVRLALLCALCVGLGGLPAGAEPVLTVLTGNGADGSRRFVNDLQRLWKNRYDPTPERLALRAIPEAEARLRALSRGRGHFAIVDAATAAGKLSDSRRLTAVAVLWPNLLHVLSRNPAVRELKLTPPAETWVFDETPALHGILRELMNNGGGNPAALALMPMALLRDALDYAELPVLLFAVPAPLREVAEALGRDPSLRVLPFSAPLLEELKLNAPWLLTGSLERGAYPGLKVTLELPAVYQILVGRRDLSDASVRKMIQTLYRRSNAVSMFNPLFGMLDSRMNAVFAKLMPFHQATARAFEFTPSIP